MDNVIVAPDKVTLVDTLCSGEAVVECESVSEFSESVKLRDGDEMVDV